MSLQPGNLSYSDGVTPRAGMWSRLLQSLTCNDDMQYLTMFYWKPFLNRHHLLRQTQVWCPMCYAYWLEAGQPVYEPLLWRLRDVDFCLIHHQKLMSRCPACGATFTTITFTSIIGFCPKCRTWLGDETSAGERIATWSEPHQLAQAVGKLLSLAPRVTSFNRGIIPEVIAAVRQKDRGSLTHLGAALKVDYRSLKRLTSGVRAPSLAVLARLGILSKGLLWNKMTGELMPSPIPETHETLMEKTVKQPQAYLEMLLASPDSIPGLSRIARSCGLRNKHRLAKTFPQQYRLLRQRIYDEQRQALQDILDGDVIITVAGLAQRRGYQASDLYVRFPELCHQVAQVHPARKEARCRQYLQDLIENKTYPSVGVIARALEVNRQYLRRHLQEELAQIKAARLEQSQQEEHDIRCYLDDLLASGVCPPHSLTAVARKVGKSRRFLKSHFPDQSQRIIVMWRNHHAPQYRAQCDLIGREVFRLHEQGIFPSRDRIEAVSGEWVAHGTPYRNAYDEAMRACGYDVS